MKAFFRKYKMEILLVTLIALAITLAAYLCRPIPLERVFPMEQADDVYLYWSDQKAEARPKPEELQTLRELLEGGTLKLMGRKSNIRWSPDAGMHLYDLFSSGGRGGHICLRSDGVLYSPIFLGELYLGFAEYRLTGCDLAAAEAELQRLLNAELPQ